MKNKLVTLMCACLPFVSQAALGHQENSVIPKISVQLWSVKDDIKSSFKQTISSLANMGFQGVEFAGSFGPFENNPEGLKAFLKAKNLAASGAHLGFEQLNKQNFADTVAFYKAAGVSMLIVPWDERAWHPEGVKEVVSLLNDLSVQLKPHGMRIGFHNHDQEFNSFEGTTYWDYIAENTSQDVVLQQDVGWTTYAGKDPVEYVKRYPGRTLTTHYKVKLPEGTKGKLPIIGKDTIDWLALTKANIAVGGTLWIVVEQEEYPNGLTPMEAVQQSKRGLEKVLKQL
ncbi:sugar phosphate isomerase/epimerase family protein [Thalassotalea hakodatensis]|uniref:sugar phosphate isomerase/epimerase family protein n=1 Tax=Thalassotalea hakodatensis TaxID=3030492 RepID=UPI0025737BC0|nr:sugar phosphate isomerase/epimerase [Thalassotalea hakodatensis]